MNNIHLTTVHGKCRHEPGECLTGPHGAALRLLKSEPVADDTLHIADIQLCNIERVMVDDEKNEARVLYWWGNSNVYRPYTLEQWAAALAAVKQGRGIAQVVRTGPNPNCDASYIEASVTRFYPNGCLTVGDLRKLLEGVDQDTWLVDGDGPITGAIVEPNANEPFLAFHSHTAWNAYRARMAEKDRL